MKKIITLAVVVLQFISTFSYAKEKVDNDINTLVLGKAKLFISVVLGQHKLTYEEAVYLWGEALEASMSYSILASSIDGLDLTKFESVIAKQKLSSKYSLIGSFIQETITNELNVNQGYFIIFYSISDEQLRIMSGKEAKFPMGLITVRILRYFSGSYEPYVITIPFDEDKLLGITITFGNEDLQKAMGLSCNTRGKMLYSEKSRLILEKLEENDEYDFSVFRQSAK